MTPKNLVPLLMVLACLPAWSQGAIFRCGSEYTNDARLAQQRGCQPLDLGPVTVPGTQVRARQGAAQPAPAGGEARPARVESAEQRARDADARFILEAELRKAEARLVQLQAEFNNGEPEKQGIEGRNHQRYLDRVQSLREALVRQQADVASLRRELARLPAGAVAATP